MSVLPDDAEAAVACSCSTTSLSSAAGEIVVLWVAGEVDLCTALVLEAALTDGLERRSGHLIVDIAGLTFCGVRGLAMLVRAGHTVAGTGNGYAAVGPRSA